VPGHGQVALGVGVAVGDVFRQVLGQVADAPVGVRGAGDQALDIGLRPEPDDVLRFDVVGLVEVVEGFIPGR